MADGSKVEELGYRPCTDCTAAKMSSNRSGRAVAEFYLQNPNRAEPDHNQIHATR